MEPSLAKEVKANEQMLVSRGAEAQGKDWGMEMKHYY